MAWQDSRRHSVRANRIGPGDRRFIGLPRLRPGGRYGKESPLAREPSRRLGAGIVLP
jgi:hypothetical protein